MEGAGSGNIVISECSSWLVSFIKGYESAMQALANEEASAMAKLMPDFSDYRLLGTWLHKESDHYKAVANLFDAFSDGQDDYRQLAALLHKAKYKYKEISKKLLTKYNFPQAIAEEGLTEITLAYYLLSKKTEAIYQFIQRNKLDLAELINGKTIRDHLVEAGQQELIEKFTQATPSPRKLNHTIKEPIKNFEYMNFEKITFHGTKQPKTKRPTQDKGEPGACSERQVSFN